ncbi:hypothetical protein AURDEDRAFT_165757 [Auricularia subglabra TFB-10046 SS5]|nr:hypothetical protein AURDEDRAFT_165757 [Auricularia subglabra TFB-10046 SS5]
MPALKTTRARGAKNNNTNTPLRSSPRLRGKHGGPMTATPTAPTAGQAPVPAPGFEPAAAAPEPATSLAGVFMPAQHPTASLAGEHAADAHAEHATRRAVLEDRGGSVMADDDEPMLDSAIPPKVEPIVRLPRVPLAEPVPGVAVPRTLLAEAEGRDERACSDGVHGTAAHPSAPLDSLRIPLAEASGPAIEPADAITV